MENKSIGRKLLDLYGKVGVYFLLLIVIVVFALLSDEIGRASCRERV